MTDSNLYDGIADAVFGNPFAYGNHTTRKLQPWDLVLHRWTWIQTHTLQQVSPVECRRHDLHQHLIRARHRVRDLFDLEDLGPTLFFQYHGAHGGLPTSRTP